MYVLSTMIAVCSSLKFENLVIMQALTAFSFWPETYYLSVHFTVARYYASHAKAIEMEIEFFHSLGNPKGRTLDYFFYASHIRHNFPYKLIPISMS